jgi:parallel beta-helix repeat protein
MRKQVSFIFAAVVVIVSPILAVLPEGSNSTIRSISSQGLVIPPPTAGALINAPAYLPSGSNQNLITAAEAGRALQQFTSQAGEGWIIRWNPITGAPNLIAGRAMALQGVKNLTKENVETACLGFVAANANLLRVQPGQLRLTNKIKAGGRWFVTFQQMHKGIPVLGGRLTTSFTKDDRLIMLTSDIYPDIAAETKPTIDKEKAARIALDDCGRAPDGRRISAVQLCIVPFCQPDGFNYILCWKLHVFQPAAHKKWQYIVDAANGKIISKLNVLVYQNVTGTVQGEYKPEFAGDSSLVATFPYEDVSGQGTEVVIKSWNLDTNPGWATEGQWTFGPAVGGGSSCGDPVSAYTDTNIYGYNRGGDYANLIPAYYLTTGAINCFAYENVCLKFMRWLGVEYGYFDNASVEVSNDGFNWVTVWQNPTNSLLCDTQWVSVTYDISAIAAGQPTVYIRWAMGPTDSSVAYPGWSIDDVKIVSILGGTNTVQTQADGTYSVVLPQQPSILFPCSIISELKGLYCDINYACGSDAQFKRLLTSPDQVVDFTWNSSLYNAIAESSVYWHVNYIHDYYMAIDPSLSESSPYSYPAGLNYPMPVIVQEGCATGYCNAYWDGEGLTFGARSQSCDDFALYSEVVYHEYTHGVTEKIYDGINFPYAMEQGAMNEAWSDYFGCILSPSQNPFVGDGGLIFGSPNGFRTLENSYRRDTDWYNEVHEDSQMFSAGLWEARKMLENEIGADAWDQMVHFARYAHPQSFEEYLLAILLEDDIRYGDNNLSNGTPHAEVIFTEFGYHGIGGMQYAAPSVVVDDAQGNANGKLEPGEMVNLSLTLTNGWANATNVTANINSNDPLVNIIKGSANFPSANYGGRVNNAADPFIISLDAGCPETHAINFILDIDADGPYSYSRRCLLTYLVAIDQLGYGDGQADGFLGWGGSGGGLAVRMTPQSYPYYPSIVRLFPSPYGDSTITVKVWDDDGPRGMPGKVLGSVSVNVTATNDWFEVDMSSLDLKINSGSFYVGWLEGDTVYYNGVDNDPPYYGRSWVYSPSSGAWNSFEYYGILANLMIQVRECSIANRTIQNLTTGKTYCCIQSAINEAETGDEIVIDRGTYYGNIDFKGKNLVVRSTNPEDSAIVAATVIKGGNQVVTFSNGENANCVLTGLTITGGNRGIDCDNNSAPQITNCVIAKNRDEGIYAYGSSPTLANCILANNGGAGCAVDNGSNPSITNCTFVANQDSGLKLTKAAATVENSVLWSNLPMQISRSFLFSTLTLNYSDIQGGWVGGQGNINFDPCFADANNGDYHLRSAAGRWEPNQREWVYDVNTSLCIDGGNPNSDWTAELWPNGRRINMGADGGTREASMSPNAIGNIADLNSDNTVDIRDFAIFANNWLNELALSAENLDRTGFIDLDDLAVFVENWLWQEQ